MKQKKCIVLSLIMLAIISVVALIAIFARKNFITQSQSKILSAEHLRSMSYEKLTAKDEKTQSKNVEFSAFFTKDLDGDGNAEKVKGTCNDINSSALIHFRLSVLSKGYLEDAKIKINGENFRLDTAIVADNVISKNYIENDTKEIKLVSMVPNGTQKLIEAKVKPRIENINDYSNNMNTVTFTGTYVYEDNNGEEIRVSIDKTINLTVDWYGTLSSEIITKDVLNYSSENIVNSQTGNIDLSFEIETRENTEDNKLLLHSNVVKVKLPEVKGMAPVLATVNDNNVISTYNKDTQELTITREAIVDEEGNITTSLSSNNVYKIIVSYPNEIYNDAEKETIIITVPVESYYTGFNNPNEEFNNEIANNIAKSNVAEKSFAITYEKPIGQVYEFDVKIGEYVAYPYKRYVVSKKETIREYNNIESEVKDTYDVSWIFIRGNEGVVKKAEMNYTKADELNNNKSLEDCTTNIGIYIQGAKAMLGENGYIKVYDADKTGDEALIATFTAENWEKYTKENPYYYEKSIKNIKVETSESAQNTTLIIHNIKEIDNEVLASKQSKEEFDKLNLIYTNLEGKVYIGNLEDFDLENRTEAAYYEDEQSRAIIQIENKKISTQETTENKITISTLATNYNESKWQNAEFIVEMPEGITLMELNSVTTDNENVKIKGYNIFESDGKYFIKIITENSVPDIYNIVINCNITPNSTIATTTTEVNLYAYNQYYENYRTSIQDIYDANNNSNIEELVGKASCELQFIAPTGLITYQTATNYDDEQDGERTVAPQIAEINKKQNSAQINVDVINNYSSTISGAKILGKIPFEGNTYVITDGNLGSQFTTNLISKVVLNEAKSFSDDFRKKN